MTGLAVREWGSGMEAVIVLHGGPAAAGDVAPLTQELGKRWHALEPFQRGSGAQPLTVATHVRDLNDLIRERCQHRHFVLVGHSWGAMLALAYAADYPRQPVGLVLIGCGTFSAAARKEFERRLDAKLTPVDRAQVTSLKQAELDANRRLAALGQLMTRVYGYDVEEISNGPAEIDAIAHEQTWADMMRLQREGIYPAAFGAICTPVLMLHGEADPHPGRLIREDLRKHIPHLQYHELPVCGHSPWLEREAKESFMKELTSWIAARFQETLR